MLLTLIMISLRLKIAPKTLYNMVFGPKSLKILVLRALGFWFFNLLA